MKWFTLLLISLAGLVIYDNFQTRLVAAVPIYEVTVMEKHKPEWPTHYFLCKRLYPDVMQHGNFMRCIRRDI